jgi:hypothetical protein
MSEPYSVSALRANLYRLLDRVLETGQPLEIEHKGELLKVVRGEVRGRLSVLRPSPDCLRGDPDTLPDVDWSDERRG